MTSSTHQKIRSHNSIPIDSLPVPWLLIGGRVFLWPHNVAKLLISHVKMLKMACWSQHWRPCLFHRSCHEKHQRMGFLAMPWEHYNILQPVEFHVLLSFNQLAALLAKKCEIWRDKLLLGETSGWSPTQFDPQTGRTSFKRMDIAGASFNFRVLLGFWRFPFYKPHKLKIRMEASQTLFDDKWCPCDKLPKWLDECGFELLSLYMCPYVCCDQLVFDCCHPTRFLKYQWLPVT